MADRSRRSRSGSPAQTEAKEEVPFPSPDESSGLSQGSAATADPNFNESRSWSSMPWSRPTGSSARGGIRHLTAEVVFLETDLEDLHREPRRSLRIPARAAPAGAVPHGHDVIGKVRDLSPTSARNPRKSRAHRIMLSEARRP